MPLRIEIKAREIWLPTEERFVDIDDVTIHIEHSLAAIAKWESRWEKPFFSNEALTGDELIDYVRCMTLEEGISRYVYLALGGENMEIIHKYIKRKMTAAWFKDAPGKGKKKSGKSGQTMTADIIYSYMVELGIPFECEHWHFNRLMTLIRVCAESQAASPKMSKKDVFAQNAMLNARRRARLGSRG